MEEPNYKQLYEQLLKSFEEIKNENNELKNKVIVSKKHGWVEGAIESVNRVIKFL